MILVQHPENPEDVRQSSRHTLFVEGRDQNAIDPLALSTLFQDTKIRVRPLGPSHHIKSAAEALHPHHPNYYFLVDRDHQPLELVEETWANFPNPATHNLLFWRRRELESYFIIPEYIEKSQYADCSPKELRETIQNEARKYIWRDAANLVIIRLREELKRKWVETIESPNGLESKQKALARLLAIPEFEEKKRSMSQRLREAAIEKQFEVAVDELVKKSDACSYGDGCWLEMVRAKNILPTVVNTCFRVRDAHGKVLRGRDAMHEVVKDLLRFPLAEQPEDIRELHRIVSERAKA